MENVEAPEIVTLNDAALDVEELEARLEVAAMVPNEDCWINCTCNYPTCGANVCS